jgi:hypothetical protein
MFVGTFSKLLIMSLTNFIFSISREVKDRSKVAAKKTAALAVRQPNASNVPKLQRGIVNARGGAKR